MVMFQVTVVGGSHSMWRNELLGGGLCSSSAFSTSYIMEMGPTLMCKGNQY